MAEMLTQPTLLPSDATFFPGFRVEDISTSGATIRTLWKGSGPPLLLLHGYPQTHVAWHKIADRLTDRFTVVLTDLRGYGDSSKPEGGTRHERYAFRAMAQDQVDVMRHLGYTRFDVASHDRGARVAHRLCLDHPEAVRKVCVMDIVPALRMYGDTSKELATRYVWWFFMIQDAPLPEHMIGCDPTFYVDQQLQALNRTPGALTVEAIREYQRAYRTPEAIHAVCEDFRAGAGIDFEMDEADERAGHKIGAPVLVLWGTQNAIAQLWNVLDVWQQYVNAPIRGRALDCGHFLAEEQPDETLYELIGFFGEGDR
jgi:haloacetate dehalogenase